MLRNSKTQALINLLDDPDQSVFRVVQEELVKRDARIIPALEEKWEHSIDEACQHRIENLIQYLHVKEIRRELKTWVKNENPSLIAGFNIVSMFLNPDLNFFRTERRIEEIRKDVWLELNDNLTSLEKITVLNHIFFEVHQFSISHAPNDSLNNYSLHHLIESKSGDAYAVALLYTIIAGMLELPVYFIDFPRNPLLAYFNREIAIEAHGANIDTDIIFYINTSNKGSITGRKELEYHLKKMKFTPDARYYNKGDNRVFILRLMSRMQKTFERSGSIEKAEIVYELKSIIADHIGMNL